MPLIGLSYISFICYIPASLLAFILRSLDIIQKRDQELWAVGLTVVGVIWFIYILVTEKSAKNRKSSPSTFTAESMRNR